MLISLLPFLPRMVLLLYVWKKSNCTISRCWVTCSFVLPQGRIGQLAWDSAFCLKRYNPVALGLVQILVTGKNVDLWIWYLWYQLVWWARFDLPRNDFFLGMFNVEFQQKVPGPIQWNPVIITIHKQGSTIPKTIRFSFTAQGWCSTSFHSQAAPGFLF